MPDDLGLPVAAGRARPTGSGRGSIIASQSRPTDGGAQARQVVAAVGVGLEDLLDDRADEERAGAALGLDDAAQLLAVDAAEEHVGAADHERRERVHERAEVEQRSAVQVHVVAGRAGEVAVHQALGDARGVREHRAVRPAGERRGVDDERRRRRVDGDVEVGVARAGREERLVAVGVVVGRRGWIHRAGRRRALARRPAPCRRPPPPARRRPSASRSSITNASSSAALAPVRRAEHRAELRRGEQQLEDAERVLAEPEHAVAGADALAGERVRRAGSPGRRARGSVRRTSPSTTPSACGRLRRCSRSTSPSVEAVQRDPSRLASAASERVEVLAVRHREQLDQLAVGVADEDRRTRCWCRRAPRRRARGRARTSPGCRRRSRRCA